MKAIEKQQERVTELLQLIKDNPDLRIVPMVDTDAVGGDEFGWWISRWGKASIEEIHSYDERLYIRSEDEDSLLERLFDYDDVSDEEWNAKAQEIEWERVIAVRITA